MENRRAGRTRREVSRFPPIDFRDETTVRRRKLGTNSLGVTSPRREKKKQKERGIKLSEAILQRSNSAERANAITRNPLPFPQGSFFVFAKKEVRSVRTFSRTWTRVRQSIDIRAACLAQNARAPQSGIPDRFFGLLLLRKLSPRHEKAARRLSRFCRNRERAACSSAPCVAHLFIQNNRLTLVTSWK